MERVWRTAFAFINDNGSTTTPAPYTPSVLAAVAPTTYCWLMASPRGYMLLKFNSRADRDALASLSPIIHDGARFTLERAEASSNRFVLDQPWLAAISAVDFLGEH